MILSTLTIRLCSPICIGEVFNLGYREEIFTEIDKKIYQQNSWRGQHYDEGGKTDRYGKKYSWIAYFELAGFRQDLDLLGDTSETPRLSDADIDPSFPNEPPPFELVTSSFLGDGRTSREEWILKGESPDLSPYFIVNDLCGNAGEWVLLDGYLNQVKPDFQRKLFVFSRGLFIKQDALNDLIPQLEKQEFGSRRLPEIPEDHYTYAGEIPWANTYPYNGSDIVEVTVSERERDETVEKLILKKDGIPLSEDKSSDFWERVKLWLYEHEKNHLDLAVEEIAAQMGLEIEVKAEQTTTRVFENQEFEVQVPIRENCWESYHSTTNPGQKSAILSKEIAEHLQLRSQPQTYDLFDETGRRASITFRFGGEIWNTYQTFIYIRKDLLDKYLLETGQI